MLILPLCGFKKVTNKHIYNFRVIILFITSDSLERIFTDVRVRLSQYKSPQIIEFYRKKCVPARPWGAKRGLLISQFTHRKRASEIRISPLSPSFSLSPALILRLLRSLGKTGDRRASKKEERDTYRAGKTRLPESRLSLLHSSRIGPLSLSLHLHIKLTHNVRHISGNHGRVFVFAMRRERSREKERKRDQVKNKPKGEKYYGKDRASSTESATFFLPRRVVL